MADVFIAALGAEVPNEQAHRVIGFVDLFVAPALARFRREQVLVGPAGICVGDHNIAGDRLSSLQAHTFGCAAFDQDLADLGICADHPAGVLNQHGHAVNKAAGAAHGEVHAVGPFQISDQAVDGGHAEGVTADEKWMEGQRNAQFWVFYVLSDVGVDRAVCAHHCHLWRRAQHARQSVEGDAAHLFETDLVAALALHEVALVACQIFR